MDVTPEQREYLHGVLLAEQESRQESRRQRLLKSARLPALKTLTGFDYTSVRFPEDYGRESLKSLDFITRARTWSSIRGCRHWQNPHGHRPGRSRLPAGHRWDSNRVPPLQTLDSRPNIRNPAQSSRNTTLSAARSVDTVHTPDYPHQCLSQTAGPRIERVRH